VRFYALVLSAVYLVFKTYARFWLYRPMHERPAVTRQNDMLRIIDLGAMLALAGAFFFMLNTRRILLSMALLAALLAYDALIRFVFLRLEVLRLRTSQPKMGRRDARHRVRRRAQTTMFH